ncbi:Integral membrane protein [Penicillium malachiteum]|nr:Integral membrane protein [Penicillium malachiteum]
MAGQTGPIDVSRGIAMFIASLFALACFNILEITISTFTTFNRRRGLYFWSMLIATWGTLLHAVSGFLRYFALAPNFPMSVLICIGWYAMVTGQSVVLYSRLHLVTSHHQYLRFVLWMIIIDACIFHIPTTVLFLGKTLISALYIWETVTGLRPVLALKGPRGQRVIFNIILVNAIAILLDASLLALEYTDHFDIQTSFKPLVYSLKLKREFTVLNSLVAVIRTTPPSIEEIQWTDHDNLNFYPHWSGDQPSPPPFTPETQQPELGDRLNSGDRCDRATHSPGSWTSNYPMLDVKSSIS